MSDGGMSLTLGLLRDGVRGGVRGQDDSKASGSSRRSPSRSLLSYKRTTPRLTTPRLTADQKEELENVLVGAARARVSRVKVGAAVAAGVVISALGAIWAVWGSLPKAAQEAAIKYLNVTEPFNPTKPYLDLGFKSVKKTQKKSRKVSHKKCPKKH